MFLKKIITIIYLIPIVYFSQSTTILGIKENYITKEVIDGDKNIRNEQPSTIFYYLYMFNEIKDSIYAYKNNSLTILNESDYNFYTLKKKSQTNSELIIKKNNDLLNKLTIQFDDQLKTISINRSNYFLNDAYYFYLKKNLNVSELVDLLDDFLQEDIYQLSELKYLTSKTKYKNDNFRILSAKITTENSQNNDILTNWQVNYLYDKNGVIKSVKQIANDEIRYSKTLINNAKNVFIYKINKQFDERFSDDKTLTFEAIQNTYSEKGIYLQTGLNIETYYQTFVSKSYSELCSSKIPNKKKIIEIYNNLKNVN